jgi:hypothetical protein
LSLKAELLLYPLSLVCGGSVWVSVLWLTTWRVLFTAHVDTSVSIGFGTTIDSGAWLLFFRSGKA